MLVRVVGFRSRLIPHSSKGFLTRNARWMTDQNPFRARDGMIAFLKKHTSDGQSGSLPLGSLASSICIDPGICSPSIASEVLGRSLGSAQLHQDNF